MDPHLVVVASRREALHLIKSGEHFQAVIGIGYPPHENPQVIACPPGGVSHVVLANDVSFPDLIGAPTMVGIERVLEFFHRIQGRLLVHCEAGWSRSPAIVLLYFAWALGPGNEEKAINQLFSQYPAITPNERIVALGDRLMGRKRRLYDAFLEHTGRAQYPVIRAIYDGILYSQLGQFYCA